MKLNNNVKIVGKQVILVPYRKHHVPKYHEWMKSPQLQFLTASEPLSLEQEYEMQQSWSVDEDSICDMVKTIKHHLKIPECTFIIIRKDKYDDTSNEEESMIGDTNIFITDHKDKQGEIEIMIADESSRGKRLGWQSVIMMLLYGITEIGLRSYQAKISLTNTASINMFSKLGFEELERSDVFQEVTLERIVDEEWEKWLRSNCQFKLCSH